MENLTEKISEAIASTMPIACIVLIVCALLVPLPSGVLMMFLAGAAMLVIGMGFFSLGADMAMLPFGEGVGIAIARSKKHSFAFALCFIIGAMITIAEPDLQVLATQVPSIPDRTLILTVAAGVGIFLIVALLRIIFHLPLSRLLLIFYPLMFVLAAFAPGDFIPLAFDSGGVTTGPITVPFIMAMGIGLSMLRSDNDSQSDSFGLVAICSMGPVIAVLILSMIFRPDGAQYSAITIPDAATSVEVARLFARALPEYIREVTVAISPLVAMLFIFQAVTRRFRPSAMKRMLIGFGYTYVGLVLFLTGVNVGFMPAGYMIGRQLAGTGMSWILIPLGAVMGWFIVAAEPAVHVLTKQVEELSGGAISEKAVLRSLSLGVALSLSLSMCRIIFDIPFMYFLIPGYALALGLTFVTPKIYTAIAFDSGGVASGPMTAAFLLPFAMGACEGVGANMLTQAFGIVAMVAMTPLITLQIMGCLSDRRQRAVQRAESRETEIMAMSMIYYQED